MKKKVKTMQEPMNSSPRQDSDTGSAGSKPWSRRLSQPRSWLAVGVAGLLLLLIVSLSIRHNQTTTSTAHQSQAQVSITGSGFSPATLSVKPNTLVTWTNADSAAHEVAADPYPKNDSIAGFDSSVVLLSKDSYSFNFATKGTYHYHDQLNPLKLQGTVVVR